MARWFLYFFRLELGFHFLQIPDNPGATFFSSHRTIPGAPSNEGSGPGLEDCEFGPCVELSKLEIKQFFIHRQLFEKSKKLIQFDEEYSLD